MFISMAIFRRSVSIAGFESLVAGDHVGSAGSRVGDGIGEALGQAPQEALHRLGIGSRRRLR
jgi:hypothetical protein